MQSTTLLVAAIAALATSPTAAFLWSQSKSADQISWLGQQYSFYTEFVDEVVQQYFTYPYCLDNFEDYNETYQQAECGNLTNVNCPDDERTVCCDHGNSKALSNSNCEKYFEEVLDREANTTCCSFCSSPDTSGYSGACTEEEFILVSVCETERNLNGTLPLPQGYECSTSGKFTLTGLGSWWNESADDDVPYWSNVSCTDTLDPYVKDGSVTDFISDVMSEGDDYPDDDLKKMTDSYTLLTRAGVAGGEIDITRTVSCMLLAEPFVNGKIDIKGGDSTDLRIVSPYVYETAPPMSIKGGNATVVGGTNYGEIDFENMNGWVYNLNNYANVTFTSVNGFIASVVNEGEILATDTSATLVNVTNMAEVTVHGSAFNVYDVQNSGAIYFVNSQAKVSNVFNDAAIVMSNTYFSTSRRRLTTEVEVEDKVEIDSVVNGGAIYAVGSGATEVTVFDTNNTNPSAALMLQGLKANITNMVNAGNLSMSNGTFLGTGIVNTGIVMVSGEGKIDLTFTSSTGTVVVEEGITGTVTAPEGTTGLDLPSDVELVSSGTSQPTAAPTTAGGGGGSDDDGGLDLWIIIVIAVGAVIVVGGGAAAAFMSMSGSKQTEPKPAPVPTEGL